MQPDTIVPEPYYNQSWDRYAYTNNNPIRYVDPTGHWVCEESDGCEHNLYHLYSFDQIVGKEYGVRFTGDWSQKHKSVAMQAVKDTANSMGGPSKFRDSYGTGEDDPLILYWGTNRSEQPGLTNECASIVSGGCTSSSHLINFASTWQDPSNATNHVIHELGHAFNNRLWVTDKRTGARVRLPETTVNNAGDIADRNSGGWAGDYGSWQQSQQNTSSEIFADMVIGWVYGAWGDEGPDRGGFMDIWMPKFINKARNR